MKNVNFLPYTLLFLRDCFPYKHALSAVKGKQARSSRSFRPSLLFLISAFSFVISGDQFLRVSMGFCSENTAGLPRALFPEALKKSDLIVFLHVFSLAFLFYYHMPC